MWRRRLVAASLLTAFPATASAGALGEVVDGISAAAGGGRPGPAGGGGGGGGDVLGALFEGIFARDDEPLHAGGLYVEQGVPPPTRGDTRSLFYLGVQSVKDSDGSLSAEARAWYGDLGLGVRGTSYFEQPENRELALVRLDVWHLGASYRLAHDEDFAVWLEAGVSGLDTSREAHLLGGTLGLLLEHDLPGSFGFRGALRRSWYQHDVAASELVAGVTVEFLQVGYRHVELDVGPPLAGPELGVVLTF
jgi:hypothetical protein